MKATNGLDVVLERRYDFIECGCCGHLHPIGFYGDCRDDENRYSWDDISNDALVLDLETQVDYEEQAKNEEVSK